jgi:hypothetical protein
LSASARARLDTTKHVSRLVQGVLESPRRDALQTGSIADWVNEAHALAADIAYELPANGQLGARYYEASAAVVDLQLLRAGLRLGRLLNEALGDDVAPPSSPAARAGCVERERCCKVCASARACGDACIRSAATCRVGEGCACDAAEVCR